jgi:hypothetical protein
MPPVTCSGAPGNLLCQVLRAGVQAANTGVCGAAAVVYYFLACTTYAGVSLPSKWWPPTRLHWLCILVPCHFPSPDAWVFQHFTWCDPRCCLQTTPCELGAAAFDAQGGNVTSKVCTAVQPGLEAEFWHGAHGGYFGASAIKPMLTTACFTLATSKASIVACITCCSAYDMQAPWSY